MCNVLTQIKRYDPNFPTKLERKLKRAAPGLSLAERLVLTWLHTGLPIREMTLSECLREIKRASMSIPGFHVVFHDDGEGPEEVYFNPEQIRKERFFYLPLIMKKAEKMGVS